MVTLERFDLGDGAWMGYAAEFLSREEATDLYAWSRSDLDWVDESDTRLLAWYGDFAYEYPGVQHAPRPMPDRLLELGERAWRALRLSGPPGYDGCLANRYRSGLDCADLHADDEDTLDIATPVSTVSLGASRPVILYRIGELDVGHRVYSVALDHGSLFVCGGSIQTSWYHSIPTEPFLVSERVSLTFRRGAESVQGELAR